LGKLKLRNIIMQSNLPEWVKDTPCHIRQNAIFDAHQAYFASKDCKFRSCKASRQTIKFNDSNYSQGAWYSRLTKLTDGHIFFDTVATSCHNSRRSYVKASNS
jgi:putative transposase